MPEQARDKPGLAMVYCAVIDGFKHLHVSGNRIPTALTLAQVRFIIF